MPRSSSHGRWPRLARSLVWIFQFSIWTSTTVPGRHPRFVAPLGSGHTQSTFTQVLKRSVLNLFEEKKMKRPLVFPVALALLLALPVLAHRGGERGPNPPRANQGRIPPPPPRRDNPRSEPEPERHDAGRTTGQNARSGRAQKDARCDSAYRPAGSGRTSGP